MLFVLTAISLLDILHLSCIPKKAAIKCICEYQQYISPILAKTQLVHCRYNVTCSEYTKERIEDLGLVRGVISGMKRITICR